MNVTVEIDWKIAKEELSTEELQILQLLIGKVLNDHSPDDEEEEEEDYDENLFRERCGLPPLQHYEVFIHNGGEEKLNTVVVATDDVDAVTSWYNENELTGVLEYEIKNGLWKYNGCRIQVECVNK